MLCLHYFVLLYYLFNYTTCNHTSTSSKRTLDEDYYANYDYELSNNNNNNNNNDDDNNKTEQIAFKSDSLILPNPENLESRYTLDVLPQVDLPDDSLADTDLRDHDSIDNIVYIYYGSHNRNGTSYGPEIIIIGSVLSCAAQLLTIFIVLLRKNINGKRDINTMFLHMMGCLCFSNLLFMLGVYATKNLIKCQVIAIMLHYLHLLTAFWIFLYGYYIYKKFCNSSVPRLHVLFLLAYGCPALLSFMSYAIAPKSYETKKFCFVSVQKGMIINYMLPVSILILLSTIYSLNGIRKINLELSKLELTSSAESLNALKNELDLIDSNNKRNECSDEEIASLRECKTCLKMLCVVQTSYDLVWFVAVLALENVNFSSSMSVVYSVTSCLLNWYIFARTKSFLPTIIGRSNLIDNNSQKLEQEKTFSNNNLSNKQRRGSSDSIPLLINGDSCTELREIRQEYISTISS